MWCPRRQSVPPGEQTSVDIQFHHTENRDPILELRPTHIRPRPQCSQAPPLSFRIHPFPLDGHQPLPITLRPLLCSHLQVWLENRGPIRIQPRTEAARVCLHRAPEATVRGSVGRFHGDSTCPVRRYLVLALSLVSLSRVVPTPTIPKSRPGSCRLSCYPI